MTTIGVLRHEVAQALGAAGIEDAAHEAAYVVAAALGVNRATLLMHAEQLATPAQLARVRDYLTRRAAGEPLDRITGKREFYSMNFTLNEATLSPRADTEALVDAALAYKPRRILDIGTGTGCVVLALLANLPTATAIATDISARALEQARANASAHGLHSRVTFVETNFVEGVSGPFDVIVSNPPYIPTAEIDTLAPEVKNYDPRLALDGGADGLDAYRMLLRQAKTLLAPHGKLLFEIGAGQHNDIMALAIQAGWQALSPRADLAGILRVLGFFR